jgi:two-component system, NarL family, nitrate/nitrite response regulator NarL
MTRILLADDHPIFRDGLKRLLENERDFVVCGEAEDGGEAVRKVRQLKPDMLLLDLSMPGAGGLDALRELSEEHDIRTCILLLTAEIEQEELVTALQLGARGVVMKDSSATLLLKAIRGVLAGEFWVGRDRVANLVDALRPKITRNVGASPSDHGLTERELLIVSGVVAAFGNKEIASRLGITEKTVKTHLTNIFDKLGVSTRTELAMFAVRNRLPLPDYPNP